jgi:hypothetical protein
MNNKGERGEQNPLIDSVVAAKIRGLISSARRPLPHSFPCEVSLQEINRCRW